MKRRKASQSSQFIKWQVAVNCLLDVPDHFVDAFSYIAGVFQS
jgi:hypothetical protein